jgi:hypothetical protein
MTTDDEPTPEELREAEALARALEGEAGAGAAPPEALEAAALLRYARSEGALAPGRQAAVGERVRAPVAAALRPRRRWWLWAGLAPLATAGALSLLLVRAQRPKLAASVAPMLLPPPSAALLQTQAAAARGDARALGRLDLEMREYRQAVYARLGISPGRPR